MTTVHAGRPPFRAKARPLSFRCLSSEDIDRSPIPTTRGVESDHPNGLGETASAVIFISENDFDQVSVQAICGLKRKFPALRETPFSLLDRLLLPGDEEVFKCRPVLLHVDIAGAANKEQVAVVAEIFLPRH